MSTKTENRTKTKQAEDCILRAIQIHGFFHPSMIKGWRSSADPFSHMIVDGFEIKKMGDSGCYYHALKNLKDKFDETEVDLYRGHIHSKVRIKIFGNLELADKSLPNRYWITPVGNLEKNKAVTIIERVKNAQQRYNFAKARMIELENKIKSLEAEKMSFEEKVKQFDSAFDLLNKI